MTQQTLTYVPFSECERITTLAVNSFEQAVLFSAVARINTLYMIAQAGSGHIGSSFSSLDIVSWLYLNEIKGEKALYYSSKGHDAPGFYSVLIGLGLLPFDQLHQLRRLGGLPGHPDVGIPHCVTNTGSLGMGVSKAKGMVMANRLKGQSKRIFVMVGDGELQEGQLWESLPSAANDNLHEITVIVDHNKLQSDTWISAVSDLGDLENKFSSFGWQVLRCDGHDFKAFSETLSIADKKPTVIIADTVKGKGASLMEPKAEEAFYRFHSGAPSPEDYQAALAELLDAANAQLKALGESPLATASMTKTLASPLENAEKLIKAYAEVLCDLGEQQKHLAVLDGDLMIDCGLLPFRNRFKDRFFECGIAEQDMVSQAGGMALEGLLPVVHSFACFLTTRANEQIYNNATEKKKVIYVGSLAGVLPAGPGHSHQSVRDIDILSAVPDLDLIQPACEREVKAAMTYAVKTSKNSVYLRLVSIPCVLPFSLPDNYALQKGQGTIIRQGKDAVLFAYGPVILSEAVKAATQLSEQQRLEITVINLPWLNTVDLSWLRQMLLDVKVVFTLDDHYRKGGQGEMLAAEVARLNLPVTPEVYSFGLQAVPACGQNPEVLAHHGLDADSLAESFRFHIENAKVYELA